MSRTKAINDFCKRCIFDHKAPGTFREQCEACPSGPTSKSPCPLWPYRPITIASIHDNRKIKTLDDIGSEIDYEDITFIEES